MIAPQITTTNSAPLDNLISLTDKVWFDGAPFNLGSVEKLYCVLAMQTGNLPNPESSIILIFSHQLQSHLPHKFLLQFFLFFLKLELDQNINI